MQILFFITSIAFFLWIIRNILFWVSLWQLKEYRLDILLVHLRETNQGKSIFRSTGNVTKWVIFMLYFLIAFSDNLLFWYQILICVVFTVQAFFVLKEVLFHTVKRPIFTIKAILLIVLSFCTLSFLFLYPLATQFVWLVFLDRILPLIVSFFIFFLSFPTEIYRDIKVQKATKKIKEYKNLLVIAVSGSYGKTSTKEYIAQVLSKKFHVVKTPRSNNTPIAIANTILQEIKEDTEIFLVEVGAVKRGEVAEIAEIVHPNISVTTAISDQHISLYGSLENVILSEYELIQALPKDGLALFNANGGTEKIYDMTNVKKIYYKRFDKKPKNGGTIAGYDVSPTVDGTNFSVLINKKEISFSTTLLGEHTVENILPAIYLGNMLGVKMTDIQYAVMKLQAPAQTMVKKQLLHGILGIDDTFNASPESVFAAMQYISLYKKKKFFVLAPLIELGHEASQRHRQIGKTASKSCTYLYLLNNNYFKEVLEGITEGKGDCKVRVVSQKVAAEQIKSLAKPGDVVLFEGKESKIVMKKLL